MRDDVVEMMAQRWQLTPVVAAAALHDISHDVGVDIDDLTRMIRNSHDRAPARSGSR